ncbi:MAG: GNAT family N-acetyltransferase [Candidatus Thorarchaeota archaeon]
MSELHFSLATQDDVPAIVEINNSHIGSNDPGGFLVISFDKDHVRQVLVTGGVRFFIAKDAKGELLGYADVLNEMDMSLLEDMEWIDEESRELTETVLSSEYVYVKRIAVRTEYLRSGVATFIYKMMERYVGCSVVVFAADKPKRNTPSIRFHEKIGYTKVFRLYRTNFGEFAKYESFFYIKRN